ncbi:MAG: hypothetical protein J5915_06250 [Acidaminococcaceae bacterium]|nr:hypothetical protein [Acidaminococcaceae bacterium]
MKRYICAILLTCMLAWFQTCLAAGSGDRLNTEEQMANTLVLALFQDTVPYRQLRGNFTAEMRKEFTAEKLQETRKGMKERATSVRELALIGYLKDLDVMKGYTGQDRLQYAGLTGGPEFVLINVDFVQEKGELKIRGFSINPMKVQEKPAGK